MTGPWIPLRPDVRERALATASWAVGLDKSAPQYGLLRELGEAVLDLHRRLVLEHVANQNLTTGIEEATTQLRALKTELDAFQAQQHAGVGHLSVVDDLGMGLRDITHGQSDVKVTVTDPDTANTINRAKAVREVMDLRQDEDQDSAETETIIKEGE